MIIVNWTLVIFGLSLLTGASKTAKGQQTQAFDQTPTFQQYQPNPFGYSVYDTPVTMANPPAQMGMYTPGPSLAPAWSCEQSYPISPLQPSSLNQVYHPIFPPARPVKAQLCFDPDPMYAVPSPYQATIPPLQRSELQLRFEPPAVAYAPNHARPLQTFTPGERGSFPVQKPTHLQSLFTVAGNTKIRVFEDYRNFYTRDNALNFGVAVLGASVLANTQMDHNFQNWYHKRTQCWTTDQFSKFSKTFGEGKYFIPITLTTAFVYRYWQERTGNQSLRRPVGDFFGRTARGYAVGAPTLLVGQYLLGGDRPRDGSSYWRPFQQNHGISGHAFIGATPFITAAQMTDNFWAKSAFYTLSILPAWSRVNDDAHYLSQAALGWYLSYLSVRAISETEGLKPLPKGLTIFPVFEGEGTFGIGLIYRR